MGLKSGGLSATSGLPGLTEIVPESSLLAITDGDDDTVYQRDASDWSSVRTVGGTLNGATGLAVRRDASVYAVAHNTIGEDYLLKYDASDGSSEQLVINYGPKDTDFSEGGDYLACTTALGHTHVWDATNGYTEVGNTKTSNDVSLAGCAISGTLEHVVGSHNGGTVVYEYLNSFNEIQNLGLGGLPAYLDYHPDGEYLVHASPDNTDLVALDPQNSYNQTTIESNTDGYNEVKFSPDGQFLLVAMATGNHKVLTTGDWTLEHEFTTLSGNAKYNGWAKSNEYVVLGDDSSNIEVWNFSDKTKVTDFNSLASTLSNALFDV